MTGPLLAVVGCEQANRSPVDSPTLPLYPVLCNL